MKKLLLVAALLITLSGCDPEKEQQERVARNQARLAGEPEYVGKLADDRKVYRIYIEMANSPAHWIYLVDNSNVVTNNRTREEQEDDTTVEYREVDVVVTKKKEAK